MGAIIRLCEKTQDSTKWSDEDCLRGMLEDMQAGEINPDGLFIVYVDRNADDTFTPRYYCSNMTKERAVAITAVMHKRALEDWGA